jgi:hypothetical protein
MRPSFTRSSVVGSTLRGLGPLLLCAALACGERAGATSSGETAGSGGGGGGAATGPVMTGAVIYHSLNRLAAEKSGVTPDYSALTISILGEGALLTDPVGSPLATGPLISSGCPMKGGCPFSFANIDVSGASIGLAARVADTRSAPVWVTTETGSMSTAKLATFQKSGGTYDGGRAFALSRDAIDSILAKLVGLSGDEVMARGLVFGLVYGSASSSTMSGEPVPGATVKPSGSGLTVVYPTTKFDSTQATTGGQGAFLLVPAAAGAPTSVTVTVTPPSGQTLTWDAAQAAVLRPGAVYFMTLYPN